ncbi:MAG TPA: type IV secretory system conjugative DNA transfer family protein [Solirubrobacteraceae bacterium]|jgi:type IV secretory pathway TraG/TraD family ATPase VirD4
MPLPSTTSPHQLTVGEAQGVDPLAPLEGLIQWVIGTTVHIAIGLSLGLLAARLMRRWHLHWSWGTVVLASVVLARTELASAAAPLGAGALAAAVRGRRWHNEDLEAGADLAEIARDRCHPLDVARTGVRRVRIAGAEAMMGMPASLRHIFASHSASARCSRWFDGEQLILGSERHGRAVAIELGGTRGGTHTLVVGATGSGKTVTQTWIAVQAIAHGMGAVIVDPKGDSALRDAACRAAGAAGRRFIEWTPSGPSLYNPCARGSSTEIADRVLAAERYTEPHYQRQAQRYVGHAVRALQYAGQQVTLDRLVRMLDPAGLELLGRELPQEQSRALHDYLDSLTSRQRSDLVGVRDRLAILVESDVGCWLDPERTSAACFDLLEALQERAVVYFALRADSRPLLAQMLGGAIIQDLQSAISTLQVQPVPALVLIDEFSALAAEHVARLFGRARSAGVSLLLGTQELSDLRLAGREQLLEQVLGNLTSLIAHRQVVPDSAELIARLAGTRGAWNTSWQGDRRGTRTRVREYLLAPDEVKCLARGHAAVIRLSGRTRVEVAQILAPGGEL